MSKAHERKKQPDQVRRSLLENAARLAAERGYEAVTIQAVADASGVTKGGLMHHFGSKFELVKAAFWELTEHFEADIEQELLDQPMEYGVFTRAYIKVCLRNYTPDERLFSKAVLVFLFSEPNLRDGWSNCQEKWMSRFAETDGDLSLELLRSAADGMWMDQIIDPDRLAARMPEIIQGMLERTRPT